MIYLNIVATNRSNQYRLKLARIELAQPNAGIHEPLVLTLTNYDELLSTIDKLKEKDAFNDLQQDGVRHWPKTLQKSSDQKVKEPTQPQKMTRIINGF